MGSSASATSKGSHITLSTETPAVAVADRQHPPSDEGRRHSNQNPLSDAARAPKNNGSARQHTISTTSNASSSAVGGSTLSTKNDTASILHHQSNADLNHHALTATVEDEVTSFHGSASSTVTDSGEEAESSKTTRLGNLPPQPKSSIRWLDGLDLAQDELGSNTKKVESPFPTSSKKTIKLDKVQDIPCREEGRAGYEQESDTFASVTFLPLSSEAHPLKKGSSSGSGADGGPPSVSAATLAGDKGGGGVCSRAIGSVSSVLGASAPSSPPLSAQGAAGLHGSASKAEENVSVAETVSVQPPAPQRGELQQLPFLLPFVTNPLVPATLPLHGQDDGSPSKPQQDHVLQDGNKSISVGYYGFRSVQATSSSAPTAASASLSIAVPKDSNSVYSNNNNNIMGASNAARGGTSAGQNGARTLSLSAVAGRTVGSSTSPTASMNQLQKGKRDPTSGRFSPPTSLSPQSPLTMDDTVLRERTKERASNTLLGDETVTPPQQHQRNSPTGCSSRPHQPLAASSSRYSPPSGEAERGGVVEGPPTVRSPAGNGGGVGRALEDDVEYRDPLETGRVGRRRVISSANDGRGNPAPRSQRLLDVYTSGSFTAASGWKGRDARSIFREVFSQMPPVPTPQQVQYYRRVKAAAEREVANRSSRIPRAGPPSLPPALDITSPLAPQTHYNTIALANVLFQKHYKLMIQMYLQASATETSYGTLFESFVMNERYQSFLSEYWAANTAVLRAAKGDEQSDNGDNDEDEIPAAAASTSVGEWASPATTNVSTATCALKGSAPAYDSTPSPIFVNGGGFTSANPTLTLTGTPSRADFGPKSNNADAARSISSNPNTSSSLPVGAGDGENSPQNVAGPPSAILVVRSALKTSSVQSVGTANSNSNPLVTNESTPRGVGLQTPHQPLVVTFQHRGPQQFNLRSAFDNGDNRTNTAENGTFVSWPITGNDFPHTFNNNGIGSSKDMLKNATISASSWGGLTALSSSAPPPIHNNQNNNSSNYHHMEAMAAAGFGLGGPSSAAVPMFPNSEVGGGGGNDTFLSIASNTGLSPEGLPSPILAATAGLFEENKETGHSKTMTGARGAAAAGFHEATTSNQNKDTMRYDQGDVEALLTESSDSDLNETADLRSARRGPLTDPSHTCIGHEEGRPHGSTRSKVSSPSVATAAARRAQRRANLTEFEAIAEKTRVQRNFRAFSAVFQQTAEKAVSSICSDLPFRPPLQPLEKHWVLDGLFIYEWHLPPLLARSLANREIKAAKELLQLGIEGLTVPAVTTVTYGNRVFTAMALIPIQPFRSEMRPGSCASRRFDLLPKVRGSRSADIDGMISEVSLTLAIYPIRNCSYEVHRGLDGRPYFIGNLLWFAPFATLNVNAVLMGSNGTRAPPPLVSLVPRLKREHDERTRAASADADRIRRLDRAEQQQQQQYRLLPDGSLVPFHPHSPNSPSHSHQRRSASSDSPHRPSPPRGPKPAVPVTQTSSTVTPEDMLEMTPESAGTYLTVMGVRGMMWAPADWLLYSRSSALQQQEEDQRSARGTGQQAQALDFYRIMGAASANSTQSPYGELLSLGTGLESALSEGSVVEGGRRSRDQGNQHGSGQIFAVRSALAVSSSSPNSNNAAKSLNSPSKVAGDVLTNPALDYSSPHTVPTTPAVLSPVHVLDARGATEKCAHHVAMALQSAVAVIERLVEEADAEDERVMREAENDRLDDDDEDLDGTGYWAQRLAQSNGTIMGTSLTPSPHGADSFTTSNVAGGASAFARPNSYAMNFAVSSSAPFNNDVYNKDRETKASLAWYIRQQKDAEAAARLGAYLGGNGGAAGAGFGLGSFSVNTFVSNAGSVTSMNTSVVSQAPTGLSVGGRVTIALLKKQLLIPSRFVLLVAQALCGKTKYLHRLDPLFGYVIGKAVRDLMVSNSTDEVAWSYARTVAKSLRSRSNSGSKKGAANKGGTVANDSKGGNSKDSDGKLPQSQSQSNPLLGGDPIPSTGIAPKIVTDPFHMLMTQELGTTLNSPWAVSVLIPAILARFPCVGSGLDLLVGHVLFTARMRREAVRVIDRHIQREVEEEEEEGVGAKEEGNSEEENTAHREKSSKILQEHEAREGGNDDEYAKASIGVTSRREQDYKDKRGRRRNDEDDSSSLLAAFEREEAEKVQERIREARQEASLSLEKKKKEDEEKLLRSSNGGGPLGWLRRLFGGTNGNSKATDHSNDDTTAVDSGAQAEGLREITNRRSSPLRRRANSKENSPEKHKQTQSKRPKAATAVKYRFRCYSKPLAEPLNILVDYDAATTIAAARSGLSGKHCRPLTMPFLVRQLDDLSAQIETSDVNRIQDGLIELQESHVGKLGDDTPAPRSHSSERRRQRRSKNREKMRRGTAAEDDRTTSSGSSSESNSDSDDGSSSRSSSFSASSNSNSLTNDGSRRSRRRRSSLSKPTLAVSGEYVAARLRRVLGLKLLYRGHKEDALDMLMQYGDWATRHSESQEKVLRTPEGHLDVYVMSELAVLVSRLSYLKSFEKERLRLEKLEAEKDEADLKTKVNSDDRGAEPDAVDSPDTADEESCGSPPDNRPSPHRKGTSGERADEEESSNGPPSLALTTQRPSRAHAGLTVDVNDIIGPTSSPLNEKPPLSSPQQTNPERLPLPPPTTKGPSWASSPRHGRIDRTGKSQKGESILWSPYNPALAASFDENLAVNNEIFDAKSTSSIADPEDALRWLKMPLIATAAAAQLLASRVCTLEEQDHVRRAYAYLRQVEERQAECRRHTLIHRAKTVALLDSLIFLESFAKEHQPRLWLNPPLYMKLAFILVEKEVLRLVLRHHSAEQRLYASEALEGRVASELVHIRFAVRRIERELLLRDKPEIKNAVVEPSTGTNKQEKATVTEGNANYPAGIRWVNSTLARREHEVAEVLQLHNHHHNGGLGARAVLANSSFLLSPRQEVERLASQRATVMTLRDRLYLLGLFFRHQPLEDPKEARLVVDFLMPVLAAVQAAHARYTAAAEREKRLVLRRRAKGARDYPTTTDSDAEDSHEGLVAPTLRGKAGNASKSRKSSRHGQHSQSRAKRTGRTFAEDEEEGRLFPLYNESADASCWAAVAQLCAHLLQLALDCFDQHLGSPSDASISVMHTLATFLYTTGLRVRGIEVAKAAVQLSVLNTSKEKYVHRYTSLLLLGRLQRRSKLLNQSAQTLEAAEVFRLLAANPNLSIDSLATRFSRQVRGLVMDEVMAAGVSSAVSPKTENACLSLKSLSNSDHLKAGKSKKSTILPDSDVMTPKQTIGTTESEEESEEEEEEGEQSSEVRKYRLLNHGGVGDLWEGDSTVVGGPVSDADSEGEGNSGRGSRGKNRTRRPRHKLAPVVLEAGAILTSRVLSVGGRVVDDSILAASEKKRRLPRRSRVGGRSASSTSTTTNEKDAFNVPEPLAPSPPRSSRSGSHSPSPRQRRETVPMNESHEQHSDRTTTTSASPQPVIPSPSPRSARFKPHLSTSERENDEMRGKKASGSPPRGAVHSLTAEQKRLRKVHLRLFSHSAQTIQRWWRRELAMRKRKNNDIKTCGGHLIVPNGAEILDTETQPPRKEETCDTEKQQDKTHPHPWKRKERVPKEEEVTKRGIPESANKQSDEDRCATVKISEKESEKESRMAGASFGNHRVDLDTFPRLIEPPSPLLSEQKSQKTPKETKGKEEETAAGASQSDSLPSGEIEAELNSANSTKQQQQQRGPKLALPTRRVSLSKDSAITDSIENGINNKKDTDVLTKEAVAPAPDKSDVLESPSRAALRTSCISASSTSSGGGGAKSTEESRAPAIADSAASSTTTQHGHSLAQHQTHAEELRLQEEALSARIEALEKEIQHEEREKRVARRTASTTFSNSDPPSSSCSTTANNATEVRTIRLRGELSQLLQELKKIQYRLYKVNRQANALLLSIASSPPSSVGPAGQQQQASSRSLLMSGGYGCNSTCDGGHEKGEERKTNPNEAVSSAPPHATLPLFSSKEAVPSGSRGAAEISKAPFGGLKHARVPSEEIQNKPQAQRPQPTTAASDSTSKMQRTSSAPQEKNSGAPLSLASGSSSSSSSPRAVGENTSSTATPPIAPQSSTSPSASFAWYQQQLRRTPFEPSQGGSLHLGGAASSPSAVVGPASRNPSLTLSGALLAAGSALGTTSHSTSIIGGTSVNIVVGGGAFGGALRLVGGGVAPSLASSASMATAHHRPMSASKVSTITGVGMRTETIGGGSSFTSSYAANSSRPSTSSVIPFDDDDEDEEG